MNYFIYTTYMSFLELKMLDPIDYYCQSFSNIIFCVLQMKKKKVLESKQIKTEFNFLIELSL